MAGNTPGLENLDEFDEAEELTTTFCQQITAQEYENQTSEETEKGLNELCAYLQQNPEVYFRIIRKRKQEELENAGVFSFLKVKMMSFLHGEQYPACLVSPEQSTQQLNQLKVDMQKAFAYSEESKGRRYSKRIAARSRMADLSDKENTPVLPPQQPLSSKRLETKAQDGTSPVGDGNKAEPKKRSAKKTPRSARGPSKLGVPPVMAVLPSQTSFVPSPVPVNALPPLPPPPPPPLLPQHSVAGTNPQTSQGTRTKKRRSVSRAMDEVERCSLARSPLTSVRREQTSEGTAPASVEGCSADKADVSGDAGDVTPSGSVPSSPSDNEFVTPEAEIPVTKKHKRTLSGVSAGSTGSQHSLKSIHSELMSSNPLTRLRSTQVARSPGGTPLRTLNRPRMPTEPLHKALVTVLQQKFRNVRTPSPLAGGSGTSLNSPDPALSRNASLNATFSP